MYILIVTILILLFGMYAYTTIRALVKRNYKKFALMITTPVVLLALAVMWFMTTIPYDIGIRRTPVIEFVRIRKATEAEKGLHVLYSPDSLYIVELASDMCLKEWGKGNGYFALLCSQTMPDFSYREMVDAHDPTFMRFPYVIFSKEENGKFIYHAPFQLATTSFVDTRKPIRIEDVKQSLHCKIFRIVYFKPIIGTSEMIIPLDSLRKAVGNDND